MAARLRKTHQEDIKLKIRGSQLINLLQDHAVSGKELAPTRIECAKFLLNKIISNPPQLTELSGPEGAEIPVKAVVEFVRAPAEASGEA